MNRPGHERTLKQIFHISKRQKNAQFQMNEESGISVVPTFALKGIFCQYVRHIQTTSGWNDYAF